MSCVSFSNKQNDKLQEVGNADLEIYNENNSDRRNPNEQVLAKENNYSFVLNYFNLSRIGVWFLYYMDPI